MPRFEDEIQRAIDGKEFPGASLLVAREGEVLYRGHFGFSTLLPQPEPITDSILWDIASLTKPVVTATLALFARQEGLISLDSSIAKHLKDFDGGDKEKITVRHLLKHTSGLPAWRSYYEEIRKSHPALWGTRQSAPLYLEKISQESLEVPVAYQRVYSDLGFILLGILLERLWGRSLDELFREKISGPLGMRKSAYFPNDGPRPDEPRLDGLRPEASNFAATELSESRGRLLRGEVHDDNAWCLGGVAGHAGLFSTVEDLHLFLVEVQKGVKNQSTLFPQEQLNEFAGSKVKFKLGWDIPSQTDSQAGQFFSRNSIGHLGYTGCSLWVDLEKGFHVIFLTNRVHPSAKNEGIKKVRPLIHDLIFEELLQK